MLYLPAEDGRRLEIFNPKKSEMIPIWLKMQRINCRIYNQRREIDTDQEALRRAKLRDGSVLKQILTRKYRGKDEGGGGLGRKQMPGTWGVGEMGVNEVILSRQKPCPWAQTLIDFDWRTYCSLKWRKAKPQEKIQTAKSTCAVQLRPLSLSMVHPHGAANKVFAGIFRETLTC